MTRLGPRTFSRLGLGAALADIFEERLAEGRGSFPRLRRGRQFLIVCDIGGSQKRQRFETFSFLVLDLDVNGEWLRRQGAFRRRVLKEPRRLAFKGLNDVQRRRALLPFLSLSETLAGVLVTFAVDKKGRPDLGNCGASADELAVFWKASVVDRLLWVVYLGAFPAGGFAAPAQDVMFIVDEDEVVANERQLTKFVELFGRAVSNQSGPMLGHLRCGTTKSDDGSYGLEDLAALPDLAAGATAEFLASTGAAGSSPLSPLIRRIPENLTWKTRTIMPWIWADGTSLRRFICLIDGVPGSSKWRATIPEWWVTDGVFPLRTDRPGVGP